jgi:hypothetical protein
MNHDPHSPYLIVRYTEYKKYPSLLTAQKESESKINKMEQQLSKETFTKSVKRNI